VGREREVTSAGERVVGQLRQAAVRALLLLRRQSLIENRGEQRMREANHPVLELDHVFAQCRIERALLDANSTELRDCQSSVC
jgi:hypothetical protein